MAQHPHDDDIGALVGKAARNPKAWKALWQFVRLTYIFVFQVPHSVLNQLMHTGQGIGAYRLLEFIFCTVVLLTLATYFQTPGGDIVFFIWALYTAQWIAERIWASRRERSGQEPSWAGGISLPACIGIKGEFLPLILIGILGVLIAPTELGRLMGPFMITGAIGGVLFHLSIRHKVQMQRRSERDAAIEAELAERSRNPEYHEIEFQRVDIR